MLIYGCSAIVMLFLTRFLWRRWKYDLHKVPSPPGLPLLGHTLDYIFRKDQKLHVLYIGNKFKLLGYPKLMRMDLIGSSVLLVNDQDFIRNIMFSKTEPFPRFAEKMSIASPLLALDTTMKDKALVLMPGYCPYTQNMRRMYATIMQSTSLKSAMPEILNKINIVINIIEEERKNGPIEMSRLLYKLTLDVMGVLAFETNMGGLDGSRDIYRLFDEIQHLAAESFKSPLLALTCALIPWSKEARKRRDKNRALKEEYAKLIRSFQDRDDPPEGMEPMWYALKTMADPDTGEPLSFETILVEVATVVFAGMAPCGLQLTRILMLLASYPRVTDKLLQEFKEHGLVGPGSHEIQFDDLDHLCYLTAVINEGMRLVYTGNFLPPRLIPKDMDILGYHIPKGTKITVPGNRALSIEEEWGDPDVFRPERWLIGEDMSNKHNLGFSFGPRDCPGQNLAMLEMRLVIVKLVTQYSYTLEGDWKSILDDATDSILMETEHGLWFHFTPR